MNSKEIKQVNDTEKSILKKKKNDTEKFCHSLNCQYKNEIMTRIDEKLESLKRKYCESQLESKDMDEQLYRIKMLQNKAIIVLNESKKRHKDNHEYLNDYHNNFKHMIIQYLKPDVPIDLDKEISKRIQDLTETVKQLTEILTQEKCKKDENEKKLMNIKKKILIQKKKKHILCVQIQETIESTKNARDEVQKKLHQLKANT